MKRAVMLATLAALGAVAGCQPHAEPDSLYPLATGLRWTYQVETRRTGVDQTTTRYRSMRNLERTTFDGESATVRRNDVGYRYYDAGRADGFYRVATRPLLATAATADQPPVLILPRPARAGAHWRQTSHTYLLEQVKRFITQNTPDNSVVLDYRIVSTNESVRVPAGRFSHCVLAVGKANFHLDQSVGFAASDVPIVQREWYCHGAGLVRLTRDEHVTSSQRTITGGHIDMRLVSGPD